MTRTVCGVCGWDRCRCETHPGYVIGSHWLETAYSRVCAGEAEAEVLRDYGWAQGNEVLRRENERLREALVRFGRHQKECDAYRGCVCGLDAALQGETAIWSARHDPRE